VSFLKYAKLKYEFAKNGNFSPSIYQRYNLELVTRYCIQPTKSIQNQNKIKEELRITFAQCTSIVSINVIGRRPV
jgi:hypothetical protein